MVPGKRRVGETAEDPEQLRALRAAVENGAPDGAAAVYLYGSEARGRRTVLSDLDIAVLFADGVSEEERWEELPAFGSAVARALRESRGARAEVDVHDLEALPLAVQGRVLTEGTLLLSRVAKRRVRFEERTRRRYFDFLPFQRVDTEEGLEGLRERLTDG